MSNNVFKLEIEVNLGESTIDALKRIAAAAIYARLGDAPEDTTTEDEKPAEETPIENLPDMPSDEELERMEREKAEAEAKPEPQVEEISDDEVAAATRSVVSALKKQGKSALIVRKEVFAKYGISQSTDCPKDQRAALIADMNALIA